MAFTEFNAGGSIPSGDGKGNGFGVVLGLIVIGVLSYLGWEYYKKKQKEAESQNK